MRENNNERILFNSPEELADIKALQERTKQEAEEERYLIHGHTKEMPIPAHLKDLVSDEDKDEKTGFYTSAEKTVQISDKTLEAMKSGSKKRTPTDAELLEEERKKIDDMFKHA